VSDDVDREALHDWLDNRDVEREPLDADPATDTCDLCGAVLGNHEGPTCNRCLNAR
jgi:hypothetical protein